MACWCLDRRLASQFEARKYCGNLLLVFLNLLLIKRIERLQRKLEVRDECVAARPGEVFANDDTQHLHLLGVRRHGVRGDDPAAFAELVGTIDSHVSVQRVRDDDTTVVDLHSELIILLSEIFVDPRSNERQTLSASLAHNHKAHFLQIRAQVVRRARQIQHNTSVSTLTQTNELVVLSDDLTRATTEVKRERRLVGAQVVDVEDEFLRQVFGVAPHNPADTGVD
jgi:hypothetical protein